MTHAPTPTAALRSPILLVAAVAALAVPLPAQEDAPPDLADRVRAVLLHRCSQCHGPDVARPKAGFGFIDDLPRVAEQYVRPGSPDDSELWWFLMGQPKQMPPRTAREGPLTVEELALVHWWIAAGAPPPAEPLSGAGSGLEARSDAAAEDGAETAEPAGLMPALGRFHVVLVHFPIALVLAAAVAQLLAWLTRGDRLRTAATFCLVLGALFAVVTALTGWSAAEHGGYADGTVRTHRWLGVSLLGTSWAALLVSLAARRSKGSWPRRAYGLLLAAAAALAGLTGHFGGILVHGPGHLGL